MRRLAHLWLIALFLLGQFAPMLQAGTPLRAMLPPGVHCEMGGEAGMGGCCCGDPAVCPCVSTPETPDGPTAPAAPTPTRDSDHFRAMLDGERLVVAHPAVEEAAQASPVRGARGAMRDASLSVRVLLGVWLN